MNKHYARNILTSCALIALVVFSSVFALPAPKASASPLVPQCAASQLSDWNWPKWVADPYNPAGGDFFGGSITAFRPDTSQYVIYKTFSTGSATPTRNVFRIAVGSQMSFYVDGSGVPYLSSSTSMDQATITSENKTNPSYKTIWGSSTALGTQGEPFDYTNVTPASLQTSPMRFNSTLDVGCVVAAHGVQYDPTWTFDQFTQNQGYAITTGVTCNALDFGCWLTKTFDGVQNTLVDAMQAVLRGITSLFAPKASDISASWSGLNTFFAGKLGFLAYPLTFLNNMFNAFTSSSSWCNATTCTKSFGNFMGSNFSIDLLAMQHTAPTLWTWFLNLVRGATIVTLFIAVKKKYEQVISK
jgi:hypothetical protein